MFVFVCLIFAGVVTPANAASTRAEYVAQVDQICTASRPQVEAARNKLSKNLLKGPIFGPKTGEPTKHFLGRVNRSSRRLARAQRRFDRVFAAMVEAIATAAPAPGDEAVVAQWINGFRRSAQLARRAYRAAKHGKISRSLSLLGRSLDALDTGGSAVQDFGISVCPTSSDSPLL
jgi:hypothetical protein